ncbi:DNA polymerase III subunit beta [Tsuneonella sp. HG222]
MSGTGVTVAAKALADAMKHAAAVVEGRNTIPILANVRLVADGATLSLTTSNLDVEFTRDLALTAPAVLETTVDARKLALLAGAAEKGAQISLRDEEGKRLIVTTGRSRWVLPSLPITDFPMISPGDLPAQVSVGGSVLAAGLRRVLPFVGVEEHRPYLHGPLLNPEGGQVRLASTNGNCLMAAPVAVAWPDGAPEVILGPKWCRIAEALAGEADGEVTLEWGERIARLTSGGVVLTGKVLSGQFPDYRRVIPPEGDRVVCEPALLSAAAKRVSLVANEKTRAVKVDRAQGKLTLSVTSPEGGTASEELPADCGAGHAAGFNAAFLDTMLAAIGGDTIEIHHADPGAPALFRRAVSDGAVGVVMPMRV